MQIATHTEILDPDSVIRLASHGGNELLAPCDHAHHHAHRAAGSVGSTIAMETRQRSVRRSTLTIQTLSVFFSTSICQFTPEKSSAFLSTLSHLSWPRHSHQPSRDREHQLQRILIAAAQQQQLTTTSKPHAKYHQHQHQAEPR